MGLIYITKPISHSWEGFTFLLNGVKLVYVLHDLRTFH